MILKSLTSTILLAAATVSLQQDINDTPINHLQVIGSHNSYKQAIDTTLYKLMLAKNPDVAGLDYEHIPLADQLDMGLRNLEIDIYADTKGGKYAHPKGLEIVPGQAPYDVNHEMEAPGFKVFHVIDYDYRSSCPTLKDALTQLKKWSDAHPDHTPVFITLEPKDGGSKDQRIKPEPFTAQRFAEVDRDMLSYLGKEHLITPDDVRGNYKTLNDAVEHSNWPLLKAARGKFLFILDDRKRKRNIYMAGHPSLKGRVIFANAEPGTAEAAFMIRNDPHDPEIPQLVKRGHIIRTRADHDTQQARNNDYSDFEAAMKSGAQVITTDYYLKSTHFKSDYVVSFPDGEKYFRTDPIFHHLSN